MEIGNKAVFTIAGITLTLHTPWKEKTTDNFRPFQKVDGEILYDVSYEVVDYLEEIAGTCIFENDIFRVFMTEDGTYIRQFYDSDTSREAYAAMQMYENHQVQIKVLRGKEGYFGNTRKDFFHLGWEKLLLEEERIILHSSCVATPWGGLLFSGPSGIGKSTQADLWCQFTGSTMINGDKPILMRKNGVWNAYGSPYAGSSKCHLDEHCEVKAIVMLQQAKECKIRKLSIVEAFQKIYAQTIINGWDRGFVSKVSDLIMKLIQEIPVYELKCTPDVHAVEILKNALGEEKSSWE